MRFISWAARSISAGITLFLSGNAVAIGQYEFVKVADTSTAAPSGAFVRFDPDASIQAGRVAFVGNYPGGQGIFTGSGGQLTTIAKTGDAAPSGTFSDFGKPGNIFAIGAFSAAYTGGSGVFIGNGEPLTKIAQVGDAAPSGSFTSFGNAALATSTFSFGPNDYKVTAFHGTYPGGSGIFTGNGGPLTTIAKTGDAAPSATFTSFGDPALSAVIGSSGSSVPMVAFRGSFSGREGIFTVREGSRTTIAITSTSGAATFGDPSLRGDLLAFHATYASGQEAIFVGDQNGAGPVTATGNPGPFGTFTSLGDPVILGPTYPDWFGPTVVFEGTINQIQSGIFVRNSRGLSPLIQTGDPLFGSTVVSVGMGRFGGEHSGWGLEASGIGNFAISYTLANGSQGVAAIYALPEPATMPWFIMAALSASLALARSRATNG